MKDQRFKTIRHIETVRNFLNGVIRELMNRQEQHDQTKLQSPEVEIFDKYTPLLRGITYGSDKYKKIMKEMKPAIDHHNRSNRHHPEYFYDLVQCLNCGTKYSDLEITFCTACNSKIDDLNRKFIKRGINSMNLVDLIEMICDWKAAGMRHADGDIFRSLEINKERFGMSDQLFEILKNTAEFINEMDVYHKADES